MSRTIAVRLTVNGVAHELDVEPRKLLVHALREDLGLTGAHQELGDHAVTVYPYDIRQQADGLYEALTMPLEERREKLRAAAGVIERNDIAAWFTAQLTDLAREPQGSPA